MLHILHTTYNGTCQPFKLKNNLSPNWDRQTPNIKWLLAYSTNPGPEESQFWTCLSSGIGLPDRIPRFLFPLVFVPWQYWGLVQGPIWLYPAGLRNQRIWRGQGPLTISQWKEIKNLRAYCLFLIYTTITRVQDRRSLELLKYHLSAVLSLWKWKCHDRRSLKSHLVQHW